MIKLRTDEQYCLTTIAAFSGNTDIRSVNTTAEATQELSKIRHAITDMKPTKEKYEAINRGYQHRLKQRDVIQLKIDEAGDAILEANIALVTVEAEWATNEAEIVSLSAKVQEAKRELDAQQAAEAGAGTNPYATLVHVLKAVDGLGMPVDTAMQTQLARFLAMVTERAAAPAPAPMAVGKGAGGTATTALPVPVAAPTPQHKPRTVQPPTVANATLGPIATSHLLPTDTVAAANVGIPAAAATAAPTGGLPASPLTPPGVNTMPGQATNSSLPPSVQIGLQQAAPVPKTPPAGSITGPRPFKATTDPIAVAKARAATLEAERRQKKENQMHLKRVAEEMPQASSEVAQPAPPAGVQSHAPHCCGRLPADCTCHLQPAPGTPSILTDPTLAANALGHGCPTIHLDDDDDADLQIHLDGLDQKGAPPKDGLDANAQQLFREASPAQ